MLIVTVYVKVMINEAASVQLLIACTWCVTYGIPFVWWHQRKELTVNKAD